MGGSSKKVTVGYKYYLGMHMVLCHGPIDFVKNIRVDQRLAWSGFNTGGNLTINKPGLFGGEDREGGVSGSVDIAMGGKDQTPNDYLRARLGHDIPAFRGVVSAVLRQVYLGMNPYLKAWAFRAQRVYSQTDGEPQWYSEKAPIGNFNDAAIYIALDLSGSMAYGENNFPETPSRLDIAKEALGRVFDELAPVAANFAIDMAVVGWSSSYTQITRRNVGSADLNSIKSWVNNLTIQSATNFEAAVNYAPTFFAGAGSKPRVVVFITDGEASPPESVGPARATLFSVPGVRSHGINILLGNTSDTAQLDNTSEDGIPVVTIGDSSPLRNAIMNALLSHIDMNPAHIIRECLLDTTWGMGYLPADIDDANFRRAADALYNERMGISLLWDRQIPIEEFVSEIVRHINATLYVDKVTGKFTLKLIRNDYDIETIPVLDEGNITAISDYSRVDPGDAINSVSVVYWNQETGENASVTADDPALIQAYGTVVNTTVQYPGFTNPGLAARAAARDLQTLSSPLLSCSIEATRTAADLNIGDVFKLFWPKYHDGYVVMRVHQISFGDGKKNRIKIKASEDVFALPAVSLLGDEESGWEEPGGPPLPPPVQIVQEAPYLELVQQFGQTQVDNLLAQTPEIGYVQVAATRPENGINAQIWADSGSGYEDGGPLDFAPSAKLSADVGIEDQNWTFTAGEDLDQVELGTHAQIGQELVRVDAIDEELGTITVGRAVLDTIPTPHSAGDSIVFWDLYAASNPTEYVLSEQVDVRVLTNSSQGALSLPSGVTDTVIMNQRAYRPFRPANLRAETYLDPPVAWFPDYPVTISWAHRNRLQETGGEYLSWVDPGVTPEAGTVYRVLVTAYDETHTLLGTVSDTVVTGTSFDVTRDSIAQTYSAAMYVRAAVTAQRDGYDSWTSPHVQFRGPFREPEKLRLEFFEFRKPYNVTAQVTGG